MDLEMKVEFVTPVKPLTAGKGILAITKDGKNKVYTQGASILEYMIGSYCKEKRLQIPNSESYEEFMEQIKDERMDAIIREYMKNILDETYSQSDLDFVINKKISHSIIANSYANEIETVAGGFYFVCTYLKSGDRNFYIYGNSEAFGRLNYPQFKAIRQAFDESKK